MKVLVNNQLLEYKDEGSGKVLLFLHGWGTSLAAFDQLARHYSNEYRVIRLDFPGFGNSPKPSDDWGVREYSLVTRDFLDKLKIDKVHAIIAHSFGGRVVIKGIGSDLLDPAKVVLIGAAGVKPRRSIKKRLYMWVAKAGKFATSLPGLRRLQPALRGRLYSAAGSSDYLQANSMRKIFLNVINEDLLHEVPEITQPTLLIWGENDKQTPIRDAYLMLNSLSHGRLVTVVGAGHFVYDEAYNKVVNELDRFLS